MTGAGANGVFRASAFEAALNANFSAAALDGVSVPASGLNSDLHADADYRAHLIGVMARRAVGGGLSAQKKPPRTVPAVAGLDPAAPPFCRVRRRILDAEFVLSRANAGPSGLDRRNPGAAGGASYVGDRALATVIFLSLRLGRPLFLEGEAGVGKTEVAKVLAASLGRRLIRLQCYEGLDVASAVYEWNYPAQMMAIRLAEASGEHDKDRIEHDIFSERYLIKRPLLQALEPGVNGAPVLLIDEIDRADEAFEAYLLEILSDFQVTIPEIGVMKAPEPPIVVITSNRTREIHDALKRRCLYHWVGYPDLAREMAIVRAKAPRAPERLTAELVAFVQRLRKQDLFKSPGVAETLDWAAALTELDAVALDPAQVSDTLGVLLKYQDDIAKIEGAKAQTLIEETRAELRRLEIG